MLVNRSPTSTSAVSLDLTSVGQPVRQGYISSPTSAGSNERRLLRTAIDFAVPVSATWWAMAGWWTQSAQERGWAATWSRSGSTPMATPHARAARLKNLSRSVTWSKGSGQVLARSAAPWIAHRLPRAISAISDMLGNEPASLSYRASCFPE